MKKMKYLLAACTLFFCVCVPAQNADAQDVVIDVIKDAVKKVIKAVDLQVQRIQNKTIDLQNVQKQIENALSKLKLNEIADWTQKQKDLYQEYFDELWRVKSFITYYKRIVEIIEKEKSLVNEYKRMISVLSGDNHFSLDELDYIRSVYSGIIDKSIRSFDQILILLQSYSVQMSDAQRLQLLNNAADDIEKCITDFRRFTNQNTQLSLQRAKSLDEIKTLKKIYGIEN